VDGGFGPTTYLLTLCIWLLKRLPQGFG